MDTTKCAFCTNGKAITLTVGGLPICADCVKAAPVLVGKDEKATKTAKLMLTTLNPLRKLLD
jgi:hypothetical protein